MTSCYRIAIDVAEYEIVFTHKETDHIQRRILQETAPYEVSTLRNVAGRLSPGELGFDVARIHINWLQMVSKD